VMLTFAFNEMAYYVAFEWRTVTGGDNGLRGIPGPDLFGLSLADSTRYYYFVAVIVLLAFAAVLRMNDSPFGAVLRAIRENEYTAAACGKDVFRLRIMAMMIGGVIAAVGGALFFEFINTVQPSEWNVPETFVIFAALIVGGRGNNWGAVLGAILVPVGFLEGSRLLPQSWINPNLVDPLRWIIIGLVLILVLYLRPQGIIPERKARFPKVPQPAPHQEEVGLPVNPAAKVGK